MKNNPISKIKKVSIFYNPDINGVASLVQNIQNDFSYLIDPHTSVGVLGLKKYREETNSPSMGIVLSTAHPGKFADVIEPITGNKIALPDSLQIAMKKEKKSINIF